MYGCVLCLIRPQNVSESHPNPRCELCPWSAFLVVGQLIYPVRRRRPRWTSAAEISSPQTTIVMIVRQVSTIWQFFFAPFCLHIFLISLTGNAQQQVAYDHTKVPYSFNKPRLLIEKPIYTKLSTSSGSHTTAFADWRLWLCIKLNIKSLTGFQMTRYL